jgi:hypothetical protein
VTLKEEQEKLLVGESLALLQVTWHLQTYWSQITGFASEFHFGKRPVGLEPFGVGTLHLQSTAPGEQAEAWLAFSTPVICFPSLIEWSKPSREYGTDAALYSRDDAKHLRSEHRQ